MRRPPRSLLPALGAAVAAALSLPTAASAHPLSGGPVTVPQLALAALGLAAALAGWLMATRAGPRLRRCGYGLLAAGALAFVAGPDLLGSFAGSPAGSTATRARIVVAAPLGGEVLEGSELHVALRVLVPSPSGWSPLVPLTPTQGRVRIVVDGRTARLTNDLSFVLPVSPGAHLVTVEYVTAADRSFSPPVAVTRQVTVRAAGTPSGGGGGAAVPGGRTPALHWWDWSWDPVMVSGLALTLAGYLYAAGRFRRERWQPLCFWAGVAALAAALLSPIDVGSEYLFTIHMVQHMLLLLVAPPLLALSVPAGLLGRLYQMPRVGRALRTVWAPLPALVLYNGVLVFWHIPAAYDAALASRWVHALEHLSFVAAGMVFWGVIVSPVPKLVRASFGVRLALVVAADLVNFLVGFGLAFAATPFYAHYARIPRLWGLGALDDLRLGGGVMWVMGQMMYAIPVLILLGVFLRRDDAAAGRTSPAAPAGAGR